MSVWTGPLTPGIARTLSEKVLMAVCVAASSARVTIATRGNVEPCGHLAFMRLIALTESMVSGNDVRSVVPTWSRVNGTARASSRTMTAAAYISGRLMTRLVSALHSPLPSSRLRSRRRTSGVRPSAWNGTAAWPAFTPFPRIARIAGRNVRLPMTEMRTTAMVPIAIDRKNGSSRKSRPAIEIMTASPLKNTARPAVPLAISMARSFSPASPRSINRHTDHAPMALRAESGHHEQRVIDRHGQADQDHELRGIRADRSDRLAVDAQEPERCQERADREDQRHSRRNHRPERDQQDEERQRDGQPQRTVQIVVDHRADLVVGERVVQRVDLEPWILHAHLRHQAADRYELALNLGAVALDLPDHTERCPVGRDDIRPGREHERVLEIAKRRDLLAVDRSLGGAQLAYDLRHGRGVLRVVHGRGAARDDQVQDGGRILGAPRVEHVVGVSGLVLGALVVRDRVLRLRPAHQHADHEQPERANEPSGDDGPAMASTPHRDANGPGRRASGAAGCCHHHQFPTPPGPRPRGPQGSLRGRATGWFRWDARPRPSQLRAPAAPPAWRRGGLRTQPERG